MLFPVVFLMRADSQYCQCALIPDVSCVFAPPVYVQFMLVVRVIQNCEFSGPWGQKGWCPLLYITLPKRVRIVSPQSCYDAKRLIICAMPYKILLSLFVIT